MTRALVAPMLGVTRSTHDGRRQDMAISRHTQDIHEGGMVTRVQTALKRRGFDPGPINGIFGPQTERAVMAFQTSIRLVADGIVRQKTWNGLGQAGQVPHPVLID
jgi:peptidoglycan hydrolase-like protein with peptidoglycan-binding domain